MGFVRDEGAGARVELAMIAACVTLVALLTAQYLYVVLGRP